MWFSFSKWNWVKIVANILFYFVVLVAMTSLIVYSIYQNRRVKYEQKELQECCDQCKMVPEVKKCKKLQVDYQGLNDAFRSDSWGRPQAQALWNASGCQKVLDEWAKHDPGGTD